MNLSETAEVLSAMAALREQARPMALATIVAVSGSTYRAPGARLLVPDRGRSFGNLSGGCLEGQVEAIARDVIASGEPRLELYDLSADDEAVWGWGLGCNGAIEVFIEPAETAGEMAGALLEAIDNEQTLTAMTVIGSAVPDVPLGARLLAFPAGGRKGTLGTLELDQVVLELVSTAGRGEPRVEVIRTADGEVRVFVEPLEPPPKLVVCGAGHDAIPLVRLGSSLGWSVQVVDDRADLLTPERFPEALGFVGCDPGEVVEKAAIDERSFVVVMSHNYLRDRDYLRALLRSEAAYIGMLGPRERTRRLLDELAGEGVAPSDGIERHIFGPAGLDIGAEGPEEIATAIVAELLAVRRGRRAGHLRDRPGAIHRSPARGRAEERE